MNDNTATDGPQAAPAVGALLDPGVRRPVDSRVTACTGFAQVVDGPTPQGLQWDDEDDKLARDKAAMPAGCTTPRGCRDHGCHGECLPPNVI